MVAFQIERQNALIQYEIQRADALQDFNINRKRQLIQYDIMRRDQEIDFEIQRQRAANQLSIQQRDMQYEYEQEIRIRDQMFVDSQLPHIIWQEQTKAKIMAEIGNSIVAHYEGLLARVNSGNYGTTNTYNSAGGFAYLPSKAVGGYVKQTGAEFLHSGEFVLTKSTVDAAEGLAKSNQLSQNQLLDMMAGGDNTTFIFNRGVPPDERYQIRNEFAQMVEGAFRK